MQQRLTSLGLYKDKIDGKAGMLTAAAAVGAYQKGQCAEGRLLADRGGAGAYAPLTHHAAALTAAARKQSSVVIAITGR